MNFYPSQINFMAATIAMIKNINQMGIVRTFKESDFFLTISAWKNCRDGSNTLLYTDQQQDQIHRLVAMIKSQDIFKIIEYTLFPDYSSRFQIVVFAQMPSFKIGLRVSLHVQYRWGMGARAWRGLLETCLTLVSSKECMFGWVFRNIIPLLFYPTNTQKHFRNYIWRLWLLSW